MIAKLVQATVLKVKRLVYGEKGEPYLFRGQQLRFIPGFRPIRTKYRTSSNANVRNDALQVELVRDSLQEGVTAVDIGAHAGQYSVLMSERCGQSGQVICFEPDPDAMVLLQRNFSLNRNLKPALLERVACSDENGQAPFFTQGGNSQSSLAKAALPCDRATTVIEIPTVRLDDWWEENRTDIPSLIKIDAEGAEIHILRGMPNLLKSDAKIVCELHPDVWEDFGVTLGDLVESITTGGRTMTWLDMRGPVKESVEYGTVLFERR